MAPLMLSVSGARGIVGDSMTPAVAADFAAAFGSWARDTSGSPQPAVCLGRDTRPSSEMLTAAAAAGLDAVGARVIDLGVVPTPTVGIMVSDHGAAGGMMITASHNPAEWNGLKCIGADGAAPPASEVDRILHCFRERDFHMAQPREHTAREHDGRGNDLHVGIVLAQVDVAAIRSAGLRSVLDSVNGAGAAPGRTLLDALGCTVVHLNPQHEGRFDRGPEPTPENISELARRTAEERAHVGFAQDPDADRLAIVDEQGRCIGEEYTLVLAARRWLDLHGGGPIVTNLSTSRMIDDVAAACPGATVHRTPVGEAHVVQCMQQTGATIGGEGNGGVILRPVCLIRDSLSAMALVLDLVAAVGRPLSEIVSQLPAYVMAKHKFALEPGDGSAVNEAIERVKRTFPAADLNTDDGLRMDLDDGWFHLRPSNTEPIVRLIAEARTAQRTQALIDEVAAAAGLKN
ncbi:MAG: phosphoglucosamine mutase [Planctomycetota bacterium]|jgi:phosphomannomutase